MWNLILLPKIESVQCPLSIAHVRGDYEVLMEFYVHIFTSDCIFSFQIAYAVVLLYVK